MKKSYCTIVLLSIFSICQVFSQQEKLPGGISKPYFWLKADENNGATYWKNETSNTPNKIPLWLKGASFNFNPSLTFEEKEPLILNFDKEKDLQKTIFIVYKTKDSIKEQILWHINNDKNAKTIGTTQRLADLSQWNYKSYEQKSKIQKANLYFYQLNKTDSLAQNTVLTLGTKPSDIKLPTSNFNGVLSEIIVYNRVLSASEIQNVASYLSIKYGVSLEQFETKNYYNSQGKIIWDASQHSPFDQHITAIGRDDNSNLLQTKSTNSNNEGLLTFEVNNQNLLIPNNYFVFWSDNGKNLTVKKQQEGFPKTLSRQWQLDYKKEQNTNLNAVFNTQWIQTTLENHLQYWLAIDYSGKATYNFENTDYFPLGNSTKLNFPVANYDKQNTGKVHFSILTAPEMFSQVDVKSAICGESYSGKLKYHVLGGKAPFIITVKSKENQSFEKRWIQENNTSNPILVNSGNYNYTVEDANGKIYSQELFVSDENGVVANLKNEYTLPQNQPLVLNPQKDLPPGNYSFQWFFDNNLISTQPSIDIIKPGDYQLQVITDQQCKTATNFSVAPNALQISPEGNIQVYPNPVTNGRVSIYMQYPTKTNVEITIHSINGALIKQKKLTQIDTYLDTEYLPTTGFYLITVKSNVGQQTFKVIAK